jgi:hypothetical protein
MKFEFTAGHVFFLQSCDRKMEHSGDKYSLEVSNHIYKNSPRFLPYSQRNILKSVIISFVRYLFACS